MCSRFEDVTEPGTMLRGGFFCRLANGAEGKIKFSILGPDGTPVFDPVENTESLFVVEAKEAGTYTFTMHHNGWFDEAQVTIILGVGDRKAMSHEDVHDLSSDMKRIERTLREAQTETSYFWIRTKGHLQTIESVHRRALFFSFIELAVMVFISGFQVYYIKGLLSKRTLL